MLRYVPLPLLTAISLSGVAALGAQRAPPTASSIGASSGQSRIVGVVVDSLDGGFLSGAHVFVQGTAATAETDSLGRFELDSLPSGELQLELFHPLLDALGLSIISRPFFVAPESTSVVLLTIPSAATIVHATCPPARGLDQSAVIGQVKDPESMQPVVGAEVSLSWVELAISKESGFRETPRSKHDSTDKSGKFRLCGLPSSLRATLKAQDGAASTGDVPITLGDRAIELSVRALLLSSDSSTATGNASVSGIVLLDDSGPKVGTRVEVVGTTSVALTDARGEFTLRDIPSGTRTLLARHLGYSPRSASVDLSSHAQSRVTITLPKYVTEMEPVLVLARRNAALDKVGFGKRRKSEAFGYFVGPERLKDMHASSITNLLQIVPGLRVIHTPTGDAIESTRETGGSCVDYYIDGMHYTEASSAVPKMGKGSSSRTRSTSPSGEINNFVNADEVIAIEVYQPGWGPVQYARAFGNCLTILLWTRFEVGGR